MSSCRCDEGVGWGAVAVQFLVPDLQGGGRRALSPRCDAQAAAGTEHTLHLA